MSIPGGAPSLFLTAAAGAAAGFSIDRSLRFNSADSAYLNRTPSSAGDRRKFTWSAWVKRAKLGEGGSYYPRLFATARSTGKCEFNFMNDDTLRLELSVGQAVTSQVFRDCSSFYHIVLAVDTTLGSNNDRIKLYVNGTRITEFSSYPTISQNFETGVNTTQSHVIGRYEHSSGEYFDGYLCEVNFIDGSGLDPTSFGEFDDNNVWQPKDTSSLTFGTNGFRLKFDDNSSNSALGTDSSGNGNSWNVNNIVATNGNQTITGATGALPILNTDASGATVQSGVRADSNANKLKLAIVGGTASGLNLTDQLPSGRSSSNASITNDGVTGTTSSSFFYGGSATVGNGDNFEIADNNDFVLGSTFTIEFWAKPDSNATGNEKTIVSHGINASDGYVIMVGQGGAVFRTNGTTDLTYTRTATTDWTHFAFVANSGNKKIFANGIEVAEASGSANDDRGDTTYVGSPDVFNSNFRFTGEFQDVRFYKNLAKYTSSFTVPNISYPSIAAGNDSLRDTPVNGDTANDTGAGGEITGNYATWNPLDRGSSVTLSNGNLDASCGTTSGVNGTIALPSSGKYYFEIEFNAYSAAADTFAGLMYLPQSSGTRDVTAGGTRLIIRASGTILNNSGSSSATAINAGDILGVACDCGANSIQFYKNGSSIGSAQTLSPAPDGTNWAPYCSSSGGTCTFVLNAGQRAFAYAAPSNYKALCTANLPDPTIADGSTAFDTKLWTGTGSSQSITGYGFSPDFVWIKSRSETRDHALFNTIQGIHKRLQSNTTEAEQTSSITVTAFNSDGFTLGGQSRTNANNQTYVGWAWDAGSSTATNYSGSINSQVRASQSSGVSIVKWTGTGSDETVGHGLGAKPAFIFSHSISNSGQWPTYHIAYGATKYTYFNSTIDARTYSFFWNNTEPTASVFSIGSDADMSRNGSTHLAYCFAPVAGFSAFGTYFGNGTNKPFVYLGFRPRFIMAKCINDSYLANWLIWDAARSPYNFVSDEAALAANLSDTEGISGWNGNGPGDQAFDIVSNGFKIRMAGTKGFNENNDTFLYCAWAEHPFKTARAR